MLMVSSEFDLSVGSVLAVAGYMATLSINAGTPTIVAIVLAYRGIARWIGGGDFAHLWGGGLFDEINQVDPVHIFSFHLDDLEDLPKEAITDAQRILPGQGVIPLDEICAGG